MSDSTHVPPACEFELDKLVIKLDEVFPSEVKIIDDVVAKIVRLVEARHCGDTLDDVDLALREALVNAIIHGNQSNPGKAVRICVALAEDCSLLIVVKDAGSGFDPSELPNPVAGQNLLATHGRGIFLINRLMDDVQFRFDKGTAIYMRRSPAAFPPGKAEYSDDSSAQKHEQAKDGK